MKTTLISFPGLGIKEFALKNTAFTVFGHPIMWYGIIITFGIILAYFYVSYRFKHNEGLTDDDAVDYATAGVVCGIIGARIYYVATKFESFKADTFWKTVYNCVAIWEGGLGFYGGLILGMLSVIVISKFKKKNFLAVLDAIAPAVMIAQVCGRWGNFFNAEAFGGETALPWKMGLRATVEETVMYVHPTFLYESLWNLLGFLLINFTYNGKKFNGQILLRYLTWYGFGRMLIEGLRTDSLYVGKFRISQLVGFACFIIGSAILLAYRVSSSLKDMKKPASAVKVAVETVDEAENAKEAEEIGEIEEIEEIGEIEAIEEIGSIADENAPEAQDEDSEISLADLHTEDE